MTPRREPVGRPEMLSSEKVMQNFRMPRELLTALKQEASRKGLDLTAIIVRVLHGYLTYWGLPHAATAQLESDRRALGLDMDQYVTHLLDQRSVDVREKGPGFDEPRTERKGK